MDGAARHRLPVEGRADSEVRVSAYESLQCPDAAVWRQMLDRELLPRFGDRVAFETCDFPLEKHPWSAPAAVASRHFASIDPAAAIHFRRYCYQHIAEISVETLADWISSFASDQGLDPDAAIASLQDEDLLQAVMLDHQAGQDRGVVKTPTVFVGRVGFIETFGVEELVAAIQARLRT